MLFPAGYLWRNSAPRDAWDWGHCLELSAELPIGQPLSQGAPASPWPEHRLYFFSLYIPQKRHQRPGRCAFCFVRCLILNSGFPGQTSRHLLTYSVQLRPELYLSIRETIVTDNLPVAEKKLCILSHKSCRMITVLGETLLQAPGFSWAQPVSLKRPSNPCLSGTEDPCSCSFIFNK